MERMNLTEELKNRYALGFMEERIITLCEKCSDCSTLDETEAGQLLEVLLQREQLMAEMAAARVIAEEENLCF